MLTITNDNASEYKTHDWTADASELGLPPGYFPDSIECSLGNEQDLHLCNVDGFTATYRQESGCIRLTIFND